MDFSQMGDAERLIAEQAVLGFREVRRAAATAEYGRGLQITEQATLAAGRKQMTLVMEQILKDRSDAERAQKGGVSVNAVARRASTPGGLEP